MLAGLLDELLDRLLDELRAGLRAGLRADDAAGWVVVVDTASPPPHAAANMTTDANAAKATRPTIIRRRGQPVCSANLAGSA